MEDRTSQRSSRLHSVNSSIETVPEGPVAMDSCVTRCQNAWRLATQGTVVSSIFILLTTCVGAGTLSLPYAFTKGGLVFSSVVFFLIMVMSIHVGSMLFAGKRYAEELYPGREIWGYADLAETAFGKIGKIAVLLTIAMLLFLSLIAYMIYSRDQLESIVGFAIESAGFVPSCSPLVNCAVLMSIAFLPVFPVTLLRNLSPLQFTSYFSIICIGFVAVAMTVRTGTHWAYSNATLPNVSSLPGDINLAPVDFYGSLTVISYCSLAFVCHFNLLPLQKELKGPVTKLRKYSIIVGAVLIAYTLYNVVIFAGYFRFFGKLKADVMLNYAKDDHLMLAARVALFLMLITSYPVLLHPTRDSINNVIFLVYDMIAVRCSKSRPSLNTEAAKLLDGESEAPTTVVQPKIPTVIWFCETWILFSLTFLPASFIPNVGLVWNFVGSVGGVLVLFIYPAACYLKLRFSRYRHRASSQGVTVWSQYSVAGVLKELVAWAILLIGLVLLVVENYQAVESAITKDQEPSGLCFQMECTNSSYWTDYIMY